LKSLGNLLEVAQQEVKLFDDAVKSLPILKHPKNFEWEREKKLWDAWERSPGRSPATSGQADAWNN
jgi:hypothetical protein